MYFKYQSLVVTQHAQDTYKKLRPVEIRTKISTQYNNMDPTINEYSDKDCRNIEYVVNKM